MQQFWAYFVWFKWICTKTIISVEVIIRYKRLQDLKTGSCAGQPKRRSRGDYEAPKLTHHHHKEPKDPF
jgi:hypothetical protein